MATGDISIFSDLTPALANTPTDGDITVPSGHTVVGAGWECRDDSTGDLVVVEILRFHPNINDPRSWLCQFVAPVDVNFTLRVTARED